ncbi:hypothetical protein MtrunA17_Chr1g0159151 [Medicago truncatula]|uniref:Uncharacterized protein n=1 Tax=Medicago truncatula TaxID=3880 RepID=A0A396JT63_MEDTR|nr:hypothetical protein MtrunA17_Chr1g0159151 [Medicago truncatula]
MEASSTPIRAKSSSVNVFDITDSDDPKSSPVNVIVITDSDDEPALSHNISLSTCFGEVKGKNLDNNHSQNNEENLDFGEDILFSANTKRKRNSNVVMSESESDHDDDDDDMNNSLTTANLEVDKVVDTQRPRRRLQTLRKLESKSQNDEISSGRHHKGKHLQSIPTNDDDELEEDSTYSEEGNNIDFIGDDFDASDCEDMSNNSLDGSNSDAESNTSNKNSNFQDVSDMQGSQCNSLSTCSAAEKGKNLYSNYDQSNEEDSDFVEDLLCAVIPKRKRTRNVFISEYENDDDDKPISKLIRNRVQERSADELVNVVDDDGDDGDDDDDDMLISQLVRRKEESRRRRRRPLRKCVTKSHDDKVNYQQSIPTNDDAESIEDLSQSEEGNSKGFIVDDFDVSSCEVTSSKSQDGGHNGDVDSDLNNLQDLQDHSKDSDSSDASDEGINLSKIYSKIQRKKKHKIKWESEVDMCADFGKDQVLCMKAVCVLFRQQTPEEQTNFVTLNRNGRGFSSFDADRYAEKLQLY